MAFWYLAMIVSFGLWGLAGGRKEKSNDEDEKGDQERGGGTILPRDVDIKQGEKEVFL